MNQPQWFDRLHSYWSNGIPIETEKPLPWDGFEIRLAVKSNGEIKIEMDNIENAPGEDSSSNAVYHIYSALVVLSDAIAELEKKCVSQS